MVQNLGLQTFRVHHHTYNTFSPSHGTNLIRRSKLTATCSPPCVSLLFLGGRKGLRSFFHSAQIFCPTLCVQISDRLFDIFISRKFFRFGGVSIQPESPCASSSMSAVQLPPPALWSLVPSLEPPSGVQPNFVNPEDRGDVLLVVGSVLLALMIIFYSVRMYTKLFLIRKLTWDDRMSARFFVFGQRAS